MNPFQTLDEIRGRVAEAIIAQSGLSHEGLRRSLRELFTAKGSAGVLLQEPILEGAHPFISAGQTMAELAGTVLHPTLIEALDALPRNHDYRFPKSRKPYRHQVEAWSRLAEPTPQSVLVTSGTGSGKTECFLLPILSSLVEQTAGSGERLEGVQAIMLYPLNALIESQRERLSAWTQPLNGKIRFCLYNGALPPSERESTRRQTPEQIIDREQLRASPPPILVTNVTMLEYMLARTEDQPIIEASKGKVRWIVLDEAHSLVGAAAAEIALLLRRVLLAFDVRPDQVRFIATSATIGSGDRVKEQLRSFLADVGGISEDRVHVIEGHRQLPSRPVPKALPGSTPLAQASPGELYEMLGSDDEAWALIQRLFKGSAPLTAFDAPARRYGVSAPELVMSLSKAARKDDQDEEQRLAPIRLHAFARAVPGVWSCVNPNCSKRPSDWPFGSILPERAEQCVACGAPVLEIVSCVECGEAYLEGQEKAGRLAAPLRNPPKDEFAFDRAREEGIPVEDDGDETDSDTTEVEHASSLALKRLFAVNPTSSARRFWLAREEREWRVVDAPPRDGLPLLCESSSSDDGCPHCGPVRKDSHRRAFLRPLRFGAPFMLTTVAPILLEGVEPKAETLPGRGRQLLSFTDSRQGTARMAAKLQMEAERNFVRSFIYHQVQASRTSAPDDKIEIARIERDLAEIEPLYESSRSPALLNVIQDYRQALEKLKYKSADGIAWSELANRLAERTEVIEWILPLWQQRDEQVFTDPHKVSEFLLLREFSRRPKRANSIETLGLAKLRIPPLEKVQLPEPFRRRGKSIEDWRAYLDAVLTHFVRNNNAVAIDRRLLHWIAHRSRPRSFVGPEEDTNDDKRLQAWPNGYGRAKPNSRPVALLVRGLELDLGSPSDRSDLDNCLHAAWRQLQSTFAPDPERRIFDFSKTYVAPLTKGFYCPVTRRILDVAPFGLTPYGLRADAPEPTRAIPIDLPVHPAPLLGAQDTSENRGIIREWLRTDPAIQWLRDKGCWNNLSDRIALFAEYARSAEHSAQQADSRLREFEKDFKDGKINILNCSTTMEMGVDIGSVSTVMMTNVPPSIANYRQRVGRAGRRHQSVALAFTFCKDRPLDWEAFRDPASFLGRGMAVPKVTLNSRPIVQRHVNAYLLAAFMREWAGDPLKMQVGPFMGCPVSTKEPRPLKAERPVERFMEWLDRPTTAHAHQDQIARLTIRSVLEGNRTLIKQTREAIRDVAADFVSEWENLVALAKEEQAPQQAMSRLNKELKRLCGEFLLSSLADRGFLPGHGFPNNVVTFVPGKQFRAQDENRQDGSRFSRASGPQRSLDLAIRDYAPGSEVVIDGLVYRSAGVTLNWKRPASVEQLAEIQNLRFHWQCQDCRASDIQRGKPPQECSACGSPNVKWTEFLRPAGFKVDPREKAHAETDTPTYVEPEEPVVSTRGTPWRSLPAPELGRFRSTREGLVYFSNKGGAGGSGYAICLHCGRAAAHSLDDKGAIPLALVNHKPLNFLKGESYCQGNERPFAIKTRLALGHEITTDVLEIQPRHGLKRAAANALAIAIREGLAQELGIEADEMGFAVGPSTNDLGGTSTSIFIFDRTAGGGGFCTTFEALMRPVLMRAEEVLDCKTPGCIAGCPACVLTSDAPAEKDGLDRTAALDFLRTHFRLPNELEEQDIFMGGAELSISLLDEIQQELGRAACSSVTIFLPRWDAQQAAGAWRPRDQFLSWSMKGYKVRLALPAGELNQLTSAEKQALRDFALERQASIVQAEPPSFANGSVAIAVVEGQGRQVIWATTEEHPRLMGQGWGTPVRRPVAKARGQISISSVEVPLDSLLAPSDTKMRIIGRELDSDLASFGNRAAREFIELLKQCGAWHAHPITRITYLDGYIRSPLVARLLIDTLAALAAASGARDTAVSIQTRPPREADSSREPWLLWHDWRDADDQRDVIERLGTLRELDVKLHQKDVPHGRYLRILFGNGAGATIVLDQGFGAWGPPPHTRLRHDFTAAAHEQAQSLARANMVLEQRGNSVTYFVARADR